jgi:glycosyltransferase involved in cell wall biosynthesis
MNVLHVISSLDQRHGGPIRAVLDLSAASHAHGVRSEVLSVGEIPVQDNPLERGLVHGVPFRIPNRYYYTPDLSRWLRQNIGRFNCAVLHGMWQFPTRAAAKACWESGVPYAVFPHGMLEPWSVREQGKWKYAKKLAYWMLFEREIFERAHCSLFTTKREMAQARKVFRFQWPARVVAPYGVSEPGPHGPDATGAVPGIEGQKFVLFLGRIHPCKNIPFLIRAWAKANVGPDWKLVIAGPSAKDHRREVEKVADELRVREQCVFLDFVTGARKGWLLRNARWFALPSEHENFGIAMFEALAHGCPVVISDQVYSSEYLEPHGRILPLEEERWVEFFRTRLCDEGYRRQVIASDVKAVNGYKMAKVAKEWAGLLDSMFKRGNTFMRDSDRKSVSQSA